MVRQANSFSSGLASELTRNDVLESVRLHHKNNRRVLRALRRFDYRFFSQLKSEPEHHIPSFVSAGEFDVVLLRAGVKRGKLELLKREADELYSATNNLSHYIKRASEKQDKAKFEAFAGLLGRQVDFERRLLLELEPKWKTIPLKTAEIVLAPFKALLRS
jgi:hypothetical protein